MGLDKKIRTSKGLLFLCGGFLLLLGMTLILVWWQDVVSLFRGMIGMILALGGLLVLYMMKE